jgi:hypothetical protein
VMDHMERESCPFHDLRADGCFQPEYAGLGVAGSRVDPDLLVKRPDGMRLATAGQGSQPAYRGVGGRPISFDGVPAGTSADVAVSRSGRPWTTTKKFRDLFSSFEHMAALQAAPGKPKKVKSFNTGFVPELIGRPQKHVPVPYADPSHHSRPPFRLRAGSAHRNIMPERAEPPVTAEEYVKRTLSPKRPRTASAPRGPYIACKPYKGTFQSFPEYIPDPWAPAGIKTNRRPLFTYAAKTKRCMPISVPWKAGLTSAEPPLPPVLRQQ